MKITFSMSMIYNIEIVRVKKKIIIVEQFSFFAIFMKMCGNKFNLNKFSFELFLYEHNNFFFLPKFAITGGNEYTFLH